MTLIAGVFSRRADHPLSDRLCATLQSVMSRRPGEAVTVFRDQRCFLAKIDVEAYGEPAALIEPAGAVSMLCGEPLLCTDSEVLSHPRDKDLERLHRDWRRGNWETLTAARGIFSAVHYQPDVGTLSLVADKLGIRLLYYWASPDSFIFASALRILENLAEVPKVMDVQGATELAVFGFPLSDRTPYVGVRALKAAEIIDVSEQQLRHRHYWRWDGIEPSRASEDELLRNAYARFTAAVRRRLRNDSTTTAFLSGGLDSRCVVTTLRSLGVAVHTFNFGLPESQDRVFGAAFAQQIGTTHEEVPMRPELEIKWTQLMNAALAASPHRATRPPDRPRIVWSGDGGSLGVGHIYLSRTVVALLRAGARERAIAEFLREWTGTISRRLLRPEVAETILAVPTAGVRDGLAELAVADPARALHLFLMLNDQRRHFASHFEDIDLHRIELQLPFFDSAFLEAILAAPIDLCLYHGLYSKWLACFPAVLTSVTWQTYPGHVACPVPSPRAAVPQWDNGRLGGFHAQRKRRLLQRAGEMLRTSAFPHPILRKSTLRLATWICRSGLRDSSHIIARASPYVEYWARAGGKYLLPDAALNSTPDSVSTIL